MFRFLCCLFCVAANLFFTCATGAQTPQYLDATLSASERVEDLLRRMTLEEKIAQMCQYVGPEHMREAEKNLSAEELLANNAQGFYPELHSSDVIKLTGAGMIGSFLHVVTAEEANLLQSHAAKSRLKIPLLIGIDAIHGNAMVNGATVFPTPIGLASTFDPELVERIAVATRHEMRASGSHWTFSPNLDVARDARWGRVGETFGEDPLLVTRLGVAMVRGYQGQDFDGSGYVIACAKHLVAGSESVNGLNGAPTDVSLRTLHEVFLPPYQACIDAGVFTAMTAHNEINGVPCHGNKWLMTDLLRKQMGFRGFVVSDWMDIERLIDLHHVVPNQKEAVHLTVDAGMDMHMHGPDFLEPLAELVREGRISERRIDESVRWILTAKFKLGLFEAAQVDLDKVKQVLFGAEHQELALEAARRSIVLLKNDGVLPLQPNRSKKVLVTGPNADNQTILGDWSLVQPDENITTVYEGLRQIAPEGCVVEHFDSGSLVYEIDQEVIDEAARRATDADVAVVVVGENALRYQWNEKNSGEDTARSRITLAGNQRKFVQALHRTGTPVVVVLVNGRPLGVQWIAENVPALLEAWEPGAAGGRAVAEVLFGVTNPSGRLPISIPRSAGQIQTVYNHKPSQYFKKYRYQQTSALFEFGHGLSYTKFEYSNLRLPESAGSDDDIRVSVDVTNAGERAGEEVVCVFVNDVVSSVTTPVRQLQDFRRIALGPGETRTLDFSIDNDQLAILDANLQRVVEPGLFEVFVGPLEGQFTLNSPGQLTSEAALESQIPVAVP